MDIDAENVRPRERAKASRDMKSNCVNPGDG